MQEVSRSELIDYIEKVDELFPKPLSAKESLKVLAEKLLEYGTLCPEFDNRKMVGLVADILKTQSIIWDTSRWFPSYLNNRGRE